MVELSDDMKKKTNENSPSEELYKLPNDMVIHHLNKSETTFLYKEIFENKTYVKNGISLQEGAVVFDVGANIGMFTLFIKTTVNKSKIYAFEPIPDICKILRLNTSVFNSEVTVYECGLSNTDKTSVLTYYPGYSILSGAYTDPVQDSQIFLSGATRQWLMSRKKQENMPDRLKELLIEQTLSRKVEYPCKLTTVSSIIREQNIKQIDMMKIDVEKSEFDIINGIEATDWPKIRQIVMELHDFGDDLCGKIQSFLEDNGFTTIIDHDDNFGSLHTPNIYARRK